MLVKGLLYFNLELVKYWSRSSLLWSGVVEMSIKVFSTSIWRRWIVDQGLHFDLELLKFRSRSSLLQSGVVGIDLELLECRSRSFTLIWRCWIVDQGLLYFDLEMLKCQSRSSLPRFGMLKCWSRASIPWSGVLQCWSGIVEILIKGLLYLDLECLKCRSRSSLLRSGIVGMSIKAFSTLICRCWNYMDATKKFMGMEFIKKKKKIMEMASWTPL